MIVRLLPLRPCPGNCGRLVPGSRWGATTPHHLCAICWDSFQPMFTLWRLRDMARHLTLPSAELSLLARRR
jgi:hypothetical protein